MNEMALDALHSVRDELKQHRVETRTELMPGIPLVLGHRGQLQEVLLNLIRNAIEAMDTIGGAPRVLRLTTERLLHDGIVIKVADTGPGIDSEKLGAIFDAFVTTKSHGMGLGLAICRMIVERHGGHLLASSVKGSGARFEITLPIKR